MEQSERLCQQIIAMAEEFGLDLTGEQGRKMAILVRLVLAANREMNLTTIVDPMEFVVKHVLDSILCLRAGISWHGRGIDIGTGAGFPGLPLSVVTPEADMVLIDARKRKVEFVRSVCSGLKLNNVEVVHARAEDYIKQPGQRQSYNWATARAVAALPFLLEYAIPYLTIGGYFIAFKSRVSEEELAAGHGACQRLGAVLDHEVQLQLPLDMGLRRILIYRKCSNTNGRFPRREAVMRRKPIESLKV